MSESQKPLDVDLRTRIARALYEDWWHVSKSWHEPPRWEKLSESAREGWLHKSDVVIAELGLVNEFGVRTKPDGPVFAVVRDRMEWGSLEKLALEEVVTRYVTDWKANDES